MFRQSPSRNQRSKGGFKVKHALQICLLLAVCVWLLYQLKHSHDKKKEFESTAKISEEVESGHEIIKLGRKDLHPRVEESALETQRQNDEETEEEENRAEEEDENKPEEIEEEGRGVGDDEIDEHDQEREEEETEHAEDSTDEEEKDREEKENEKDGQNDDNSLSEDQDHDGGDRITQEAREENYKGDDASSAVVKDTQEIEDSGGSNMAEQAKNAGNTEPEQENTSNSIEEVIANENDSGSKMGEGEKVVDDPSANATMTEEKMEDDVKVESHLSVNVLATEDRSTKGTLAESENGSTSNSTLTTESNKQIEVNDNLTADNAKTSSSSLQNGTEKITDPTQHQNASEESGRPIGGDNYLQTDVLEQINSNTTERVEKSETNTNVALNTGNSDVASGEQTDASGSSSSVVPELQAMDANVTAVAEDLSSSLTTNENAEMVQSEKSDKTTGMEENKDGFTSSMTNENEHATQHDTTGSSDPTVLQEVKEAQTNLGTLPDTKTEEMNNDDVATE